MQESLFTEFLIGAISHLSHTICKEDQSISRFELHFTYLEFAIVPQAKNNAAFGQSCEAAIAVNKHRRVMPGVGVGQPPPFHINQAVETGDEFTRVYIGADQTIDPLT